MVHSYALAVSTNGEHLTCGGFSLNETIRFGNLDGGGQAVSPIGRNPRHHHRATGGLRPLAPV
jgi:hypothetical protein